MIRTLEDFSRRLDELQVQIRSTRASRRTADERQALTDEFRSILIATQETPTSLRNRVDHVA